MVKRDETQKINLSVCHFFQEEYRIEGDIMYFESFPLNELLYFYLYNLLKITTMDDNLLELSLTSMQTRDRLKFADYIKDYHEEPEIIYEMLRQDDIFFIAKNIVRDISNWKLKLTFGQIRYYLAEIFYDRAKQFFGRTVITPELEELKRIFRLSYDEIKIICFLYTFDQYENLSKVFSECNFQQKLRLISAVAEVPIDSLKKLLSRHFHKYYDVYYIAL